MSNRKLLNLLVLAALLLGMLPMVALAAPASPDWSKVHPTVLEALNATGKSGFYAILVAQADLTGADAQPTKQARTAFVFERLTRVARETQTPLLDYLRSQGVAYRSRYIQNMVEIPEASRAVVAALVSRPDVAQIAPVPKAEQDPVYKEMTPDQRFAAIEWNVTRVHAPEVWALGYRGEGYTVASNDTGVDYTHPALNGKYRGNLGGGNFDHNYNWWNGPGSAFPTDGDGHGTHTMGTMVGDDGAGNQIGVAPGATWIACGGLYNSDPVECFEFFLAPWDLNGQNADPAKAPDAINNSWYDTSGYDYRPIIQALSAAGVAVIKSAGNWGPSCSTISPPGNVPETIATAAFGTGDVIASFSSRGPDSSYGQTILKPEVAAPGVNIRSSVPGGGYEGGWSGTSMAAPHTTATVALLWSAAACIAGDVPLTKQILMETAEAKIDSQCPPFVDHPNDVWGWGVLDDLAAVQYAIGLCGGLGTLEGTVTDAGTGLPIDNAQVLAQGAGGFSKTVYTDPAGFYTMSLMADTYTVTGTQYGYESGIATGVVVVTDQTTVQDLALNSLPVYTVSGHVTDAATNAPLIATVQFTDAPVPPVTTDPSGYYSIAVAEGAWTLMASADLHQSQTVSVLVDGNITQDFALEPLPCILLVDDDNNAPDTLPYFTAALDTMGLAYGVFDTAGGDGPSLAGLQGYKMVFWFSGDAFGGTAGPSANDEANLAAYLDGGGNLFLSSQDYLYDFGLTPFGQNYLGIASFSSDTGDATGVLGLAGDPIGDGLGPYDLTYPSGFSDYGDIVNAAAGASTAFKANNNANTLDVDKAGATWKTVFFGTDWVAIYNNNAANGITVLQRIVDWFGGCEPPQVDTMHVGDIQGNFTMDPYGRPVLRMRVMVHDEAHAPLGTVAVDASITYPGGGPVQRTRMTKANGWARFHWGSSQAGAWELCVDNLTLGGYVYAPGDNEVNCQQWQN